MLDPAGPEYALADNLTPLLDFVRAVVAHDHRQRVREVAPSAALVWCDPLRALVRPTDPADTEALQDAPDWTVTGVAKYQEFGLQFFLAGEPIFWHAPDDAVSPAGVVCHSLLIEQDVRRVSYAMLLIEHADIGKETLITNARWYELDDEVTAMYRALSGETASPEEPSAVPLPSETEYKALEDQYGVT